MSLRRLEAVGIATNLLMYANVVTHMLVHFEPNKLIYFVLMAVVFSTSAVTVRATLGCVALSIVSLLFFARGAPTAEFEQFAFIGLATSFASLGMGTLLRMAILRQIDARLLADRLAASDSLTGIANRRAVFATMARLESAGSPFWIGILDLDGFKAVNDIYGHAIGDVLLADVVKRIVPFATPAVHFGRIGGDEFAILVEGGPDPAPVRALGDAIIARIREPFAHGMLRLAVGGTIGFAHCPPGRVAAVDAYEQADFALYSGKQRARGTTMVFTGEEETRMRESILLERGLREADLERELYLLFQPQVGSDSGMVVGFEALARWNSPTLGAIPPDRFIRAAERAGLTKAVTRVLFAKGLAALADWPEPIRMSFNLSAQDLADRPFLLSLADEVNNHGIAPDRVEFEITETAVMKDIAAASALLHELAARGFRIALDDFGSGYSSFEYIDQLPLTKVKVDKSFVRKITVSRTSREIVAGVIGLCRNLGLDCVLEGIETEDELEILRPLSPQLLQGYLFGRPMAAAEAQGRAAIQPFRAGPLVH
ncbi:putative bifunctional diguanylate cyclase/phosphodiesterase [Sphingomonas elodea]|uniref:putative bifunctional diguanylate cyclase/phosphodiesterase n=1 Tax=Sphingomonas elodea TaxID=179878 RepID=UPI0002631D5D|nr:EAL domain-containing protein [Sphingomonas elodea]